MELSILINKKKFLFVTKLMVLQACLNNNIDVPRFCFHESLQIAGNCRLCLIEIAKFLKPAASCAYPIANNLEIYTNTLLVKKAREGILEFLLINHPLDCPICDWGGECDLQDQVLIFGGDRGRYYEVKRSVEFKLVSPLIKMLMTRCIHCTRCVRFLTEISNDYSLGAIGRGSNMEISSFLKKMLISEISGNIIDLCPVGALTSIPYSFINRPWKALLKLNSIDILDSLGSNIYLEINNGKIIRILPKYNKLLNDDWITDKVRFFYDSFHIQRLGFPFLVDKNLKKLIYISWENAFIFIKKKLKLFKSKSKHLIIKGIYGPLLDLESLVYFKDFLNKLGTSNIYSEIDNLNINFDLRNNFLFMSDFLFLENLDCIFFVGIDLNKENSLLPVKIKKLTKSKNIIFINIGSNFNTILDKVINVNLNILSLFDIFEGKHWLSLFLCKLKKVLFIFGESYLKKKDLNKFFLIKNLLTKNLFRIQFFFKFITLSISKLNGLELGVCSFLKQRNKELNSVFYFFLGISKKNLKFNVKKADFCIYQGHSGNDLIYQVDLVLPSLLYIEKSSIFLNLIGLLQHSKKALPLFLNAKKDSDIFFSLSFYLNKGISYFPKYFLLRLIEISPITLKKVINKTKLKLKKKNIKNFMLFIFNIFFFYSVFNSLTLNVLMENSKNIQLLNLTNDFSKLQKLSYKVLNSSNLNIKPNFLSLKKKYI